LNVCKFTNAFCLQLINKSHYFNYLPTTKKLISLLYLLFTIYFIACCYFICKLKFVKDAGLGTKTTLILFTIKIGVGIFGGLISHFLFFDKTDLYGYTLQGLVEYNNLIHHPKIFFTDSIHSNYGDNLGEFFGSNNSFWNDLRNNILLKTIGILNIFSRGNYYINSLFFNVAGFIGHVALYKIFKPIYPKQYWAVISGCFLLPSTLYYTSIIGKDIMVFVPLSIFCYALYFSLQKSFTTKRICALLISFLAILFIRNFIAIILLPCAFVWYVSVRYKIQAYKVFAVLFLCSFFGIYLVQWVANPLAIVVAKQQAFFALGNASSQYENYVLQPTIKSFIAATPTALRHAFLSPYLTEFNNIYLNMFAAEMVLYLLLFLLYFIFPCKNNSTNKEFIAFALVFTFLIFLFTGYITTNAGSLVRYRSIYLPFLMLPVLCGINWERLFRLNKNNKHL
jgi:hypothetical protein